MHFVRDYLTAGDRFIDVGANVGVFTLTVASVAGSVAEAFEPSSTAFPRLVENIELNLPGARVHAYRAAVGREPGTVHLTMGLDAMSRIVDEAAHDVPSEEVELVSLDECFGDGGDVALVKVDVEGLEEDVLRGASNLLARVRPTLIIEANDRQAIARVLDPLGYRQYSYDPPTSPSLRTARRTGASQAHVARTIRHTEQKAQVEVESPTSRDVTSA